MEEKLIVWDNSYSVGNRIIDDQHQQLVDMLNQLNLAYLKGDKNKDIATIILKLIDYTSMHFATEERYFEQTNFELTEEHKKEHSDFVAKVNSFKTKFNEGESDLTSEVLEFLKDWLNQHILVSDKKYIDTFVKHRISRKI